MFEIDYSADNLVKISQDARGRKKQQEIEAMLNYVPHFWGNLVAAAENGEEFYAANLSYMNSDHEWVCNFLNRNGFVYGWGNDKDGLSSGNDVIVTISLTEKKF